jgi:hypothetical protein
VPQCRPFGALYYRNPAPHRSCPEPSEGIVLNVVEGVAVGYNIPSLTGPVATHQLLAGCTSKKRPNLQKPKAWHPDFGESESNSLAARTWNIQRSRLLLRMYESGRFSTGEIAERLRVSPPTVYDRLRRLGLGTSSLPRRYRAAVKCEFTEDETQKIIGWKKEGLYNTNVALRLGKTIGPINRIVRELELPTSSYKPIPTGTRFGSLTVIDRASSQRTYKGHFESRSWTRCDCGRKVVIFNHALRSGNTKTCGCKILRRNPDAVWVRVRSNITIGARARGHGNVNMSLGQIKAVWSRPCFYCGIPKSNELKGRKRGRSTRATVLRYTGIDQVVPGDGYTLGNVLPCCRTCNRAKSDLSLKLFLSWLRRFGKNLTPRQVLKAAKMLGRELERVERLDAPDQPGAGL